MVRGNVESWSDDVGWGVLVSPEVSGKVFAHHIHIRGQGDGFRTLRPGTDVVFEYHEPGQDGCEFGADWVMEADIGGDND